MRIVNKIEISAKTMPEYPQKIKKFQEESNEWKRALEFMLRENALLKSKLAALLKNYKGAGKDFLEVAENYQSLFIREDESINLLRRDIASHEKWLLREIYEDGQIIKGVLFRQQKLRKDIIRAQKEFGKLKKQFEQYVKEAG